MNVTYHGDQATVLKLIEAVDRHCQCEFSLGTRVSCCEPHRMLARDQRALDGLLFGHFLAARLQREEWCLEAERD